MKERGLFLNSRFIFGNQNWEDDFFHLSVHIKMIKHFWMILREFVDPRIKVKMKESFSGDVRFRFIWMLLLIQLQWDRMMARNHKLKDMKGYEAM